MEVKQTGYCFLIIPSHYKSFLEKGKNYEDIFILFLVVMYMCTPKLKKRVMT